MRYKRNSTMKRYYKIDSPAELLQFIKKNGVIKGDIEHE